MSFSSPLFIFIFLPFFLLLLFAAPAKFRDYILLAGSLAFYFWGEPVFCFIAIISSLLDYWLCKKIYSCGVLSKSGRLYVALGVSANLLILLYYKYTNFFLASFSQLLAGGKYHFEFFDIILPIGVSFIVFEKITYLVDVYRRKGEPAKSLLTYLNYVFLFPKLLAGPIIKYHEIERQLYNRVTSSEGVIAGFKRFVLGLTKKIFIADTCGSFTNQVFSLPYNELSFGYAWLGILCFTIQIYFDFSGYSDMALGLARIMGFELRENFNLPYISANFTEFWRRWHISLSTWIREYLYIPLGGNRVNTARIYLNLWVCFLLSGLWHGANWTFLIWGAYNGMFLVLDKLFWIKLSSKLPHLLRIASTLLLIMLGWVIFRSSSLEQVRYYMAALSNPASSTQNYLDLTPDIFAAIGVGTTLILTPLLPRYTQISGLYRAWQGRLIMDELLIGSLGLLALCKVVGNSYTPFLYFRF